MVGQTLPPNATYFTRLARVCIDGGADAPVRGRPPGRPNAGAKELILPAKSGSRGTRADQGVRPTIYAEFAESSWSESAA